jgi:hypothetical protein
MKGQSFRKGALAFVVYKGGKYKGFANHQGTIALTRNTKGYRECIV